MYDNEEIRDERVESLRKDYNSHGYGIVTVALVMDLFYNVLTKSSRRWDIFFILLISSFYVLIRNILSGTYVYPLKKIPVKEIVIESLVFSILTTVVFLYLKINICFGDEIKDAILVAVVSFIFWATGNVVLIKLSNKYSNKI